MFNILHFRIAYKDSLCLLSSFNPLENPTSKVSDINPVLYMKNSKFGKNYSKA